MLSFDPSSILRRGLRVLPLLCLLIIAGCTNGDGGKNEGDTVPDDAQADIVGVDTLLEVLPGDIEPNDNKGELIEPEIVGDVLEELHGDVVPEIEPDVGPCGEPCDDGDPCTKDECDPELGCVHTLIEDCCPDQFPLELGFEGDDPMAGGQVEALVAAYPDAPDLAPLTWQVVTDFAWAGDGSLFFGNPEMGNYHNDHRVASRFITAPVNLEAGYNHTLSLQAWIDVEEGIWSDYLVIFARAGGDDYPIWSKDDFNVSMGSWNEISVDLTPFAGESVSLVFLFDTHDEQENFGGGIYLDEIAVERACEPLTCTGLTDCFTLSPCLDGQCVDGACVYTWDSECCLSPAECEDWDGCTLEFCDSNVCYSQPDPDPSCCNTNEECADEDDICTADVCKNNVCTYLPTGATGCCLADIDCNDTDPCTKDLCTNQACVYVNLCCAIDEDCDDGDDQCTDDQCIDGKCYFIANGAEGCCVSDLINETFEDMATPDFTLESTLSGVAFEAIAGDAYSGGKALIIEAVEPSGSFTATATLSVAEIPPQGAELSFAVKLTMADSGDCGQNELRVVLGSEVLWSGCATLNNYLPVTLDLSEYAGTPGPVAFVFDVSPIGAGGTYWAGIDSVHFSQDCCSADMDCEDGNPCTADVCPGSNAVCQFPPIEGCCLNSAECDDGDICSQDVCTEENVCEHFNLCCESDAECDDEDDVCTNDLCINSFCEYIPTGASGCCVPLTWQEDFETGTLTGWAINGSTGDFGWHASNVKATSGSFSLAYSNSTGTDYNDNAFGTALSPSIDLPDQSGVAVSFQLSYDIESCCDDFDLYLVTDAGDVNLGNWAGTGQTTWQEVLIDLNEWAGQTVQFRFEFDSDSSLSYTGVFIDDLSIVQECCSDDAECDDGDPCTTDSCPGIDSLCAFIPIEGCCTEDVQCGDGDACTEDSCTSPDGGTCLNIWVCCDTDADCDDGEDVCTEDVCVDNYCQFNFTGAPGCCEPVLWEDGFENGQGGWVFDNLSATPSWHLSTVKFTDGGTALAFSNAAGDSTGNSQDSSAMSPPVEVGVQPGVALTFQVWYDTEGTLDWCKVWVDYDGGSALLDQFTGHTGNFWQEKTYSLEEWAGQTVSFRLEWHCDGSVSYPGIWFDEMAVTQGCCNADVDCEDNNPCTEDDCPGLESMCNNTWIEGCCLNNEGCDDDDPCTEDTCTEEGGVCEHVSICCQSDDDCDDGDDVCTDDLCIDSYCQFIPTGAAGCCVPEVYLNDFEGDLDGWMINNSSSTYGWKLSTAKAVSGSQSLAYTDAAGATYGVSNNGSCLSPEVELPNMNGLTLSFQLWYEIESCCDDFNLSVVHPGGTTLIANYAGSTAPAWAEVTFIADAYKGQTVQLLFEFNCDSSVSYDGVFIDDLMVTQDCCSEDADCDDGDVCTADSCPGVESLCIFTPIPGCCATNADCDDGDVCTEDSCPVPGGTCLNVDICCTVDADCDDGDDLCTDDTCVDGVCAFTPTGAIGCCQPEIWADNFENGPGDWAFSGGDGTYSWHLSTAEFHDGAYALNFGNAAGTSYGNSQSGVALSPMITMGNQPDQALNLWVWYDTEAGADWIKLFVVHDGGEAELDQFTGHDQGFWEERSYDLGDFINQEIQLRLQFQSDSSIIYPGAFFDGMEITQGCCNSDLDCDDGNPCTEDLCPGAESVCINTPIPGCCVENIDCDDEDPCTQDVCADAVCEHLDICCTEDVDCDDGDDVCTNDTCIEGFCVYTPTGDASCCTMPLFLDTFTDELDWNMEGEWEWGQAEISTDQQTGNPDPAEDHTGSDDNMILGVVLGGSLDDSVPHAYYYATSPEIDASGITSTLMLSYWRVLNSDYAPYSNNSVEVWDGAAWQILYETGITSPDDEDWTYFEHDITAYANDLLQVRFGYSVGEGVAVLAGSSWNLDDVRVQEALPPYCCSYDSDCEGMGMTCYGAICIP